MRRLKILSAFGLCILCFVGFAYPPAGLARTGEAGAQEDSATDVIASRRTPVVIAVEKVSPAVVNISTEKIIVRRHPFFDERSPFFDPFFEEFFRGFGEHRFPVKSLGSGVIIHPSGYIVTNDHVVRKASKIHITLADKSKFEASILSSDPQDDIAILKIDAPQPLPFLKMGTSSDLMIGETVIAVGNPFGLEHWVTVGVLSAKGRSISVNNQIIYKDLLGTSALINPGNSGGPLLNINGGLIGINTAIKAGAQGISFAIPADRVKKTVLKLLKFRTVNRIHLEVKVDETAQGLVISEVKGKSPAEGKLLPGDTILSVDGAEISGQLDFAVALLNKSAGDEIRIDGQRKGKRFSATVTLAPPPTSPVVKLAQGKLGIMVQELTHDMARQLNLRKDEGVLISAVERGGPGETAGLRPGDVIYRFGMYEVRNLAEFGKSLEMTEPGDEAFLFFYRGGESYYTKIKVK